MAGTIIDTYLSETAEHYINIESRFAHQAINNFENLSNQSSSVSIVYHDPSLFDQCFHYVENDLFKQFEDFKRMN